MPQTQKLSDLIGEIDATISSRFSSRNVWIQAEITDVKKYADKRWCFLKFIEKEGNQVSAEIKGVFWSNAYSQIERFEQETGQNFSSGMEITCQVRVRFHKRFGLNLEVMAIDFAYAIGRMEMERKQTLDRLVRENAGVKVLSDGSLSTINNRLDLPTVIQRIALVTAPNSDGQRDFKECIRKNKYGYTFLVGEFLAQVQGDAAAGLILQQLKAVLADKQGFDLVVIVRGGGSDTDFKPFNSFELADYVASYPLPVLTGIGHDRNTSIVDLVARQHKTPTEVASFIIDRNMGFERGLMQLKERFFSGVKGMVDLAARKLAYNSRIVRSCSPGTILNKGFAMLVHRGRILTDPDQIAIGEELQAILKDQTIHTLVNKKEINGNKPGF